MTSTHEPSSSSSPCAAALGRREFLGASVAAASLAGALGAALPNIAVRSASAADAVKATGRARNVIVLIADGMSMGTFQMADLFARMKHGRGSHWATLLTRPGVRRSLVDTAAADSIVTDSAAASTQWGTGEPANNGAIGVSADGREVEPILVRARHAGKATGLVTTCRVTHATPAGFVANIPAGRNDEVAIAQQMLERRVDVLLGGGSAYVTPQLLAAHPDARVVRTASELDAAATDSATGRLIGLFAEQHMSYEIDREAPEPSLADMTRAALRRLERAPDGFILQVEGGRVDHAAHDNDAAALVHDQVAFDEAVGVAFEWASQRHDTLVIVTTDHGNANPGITDYGVAGNRGFAKLLDATHSFARIIPALRTLGPAPDLAAVRDTIRRGTAVTLSDRDAQVVRGWLSGEAPDPFLLANKNAGPLGSVLANSYAVAFLSPNHTADAVELSAWGPGSERIAGYSRTRDLHAVMVQAMGI